MPCKTHLKSLTTAALLSALLTSARASYAEIIVGSDDGTGKIINTDVTDHLSNTLDPLITTYDRIYIAQTNDGDLYVNNQTTLNATRIDIGKYNTPTIGNLFLSNATLNSEIISVQTNHSVITASQNAHINSQSLFISDNSRLNLSGPLSKVITHEIYLSGFGTPGTLNIADGANFTTANATLGLKPESHGILNITGPGSTFTATSLFHLAFRGSATVNLDQGATLNTKNVSLATDYSAIVTINLNGPNTSWFNSQDITIPIGYSSNKTKIAAITLTKGATLTSNNAQIHNLTIDGADSTLLTHNHLEMISSRLNNLLTLKNGGQIQSNKFSLRNDRETDIFEIIIQGQDTKFSTEEFKLQQHNVTLKLKNDATIETTDFNLGHHPSGGGRISLAPLPITPLQVNTSITIENNAQIIALETFNLLSYSHDTNLRLSPNSNQRTPIIALHDAFIDGYLNISTNALTTLNLLEELRLIEIGNTQSGAFENFAENQIAAYHNDLALRLTYQGGDGNDISLIASELPELGDANDDGQVSQADLDLLKEKFGQANTVLGDANFDSQINLDDLATLRNHFKNNPVNPPAGTANIPEPTTLVLLSLTLPMLLKRKQSI